MPLLRRLIDLQRKVRKRLLARARRRSIGGRLAAGTLDEVHVEGSGRIQLFGTAGAIPGLEVQVDGAAARHLHAFWLEAGRFCIEFVSERQEIREVVVREAGREVVRIDAGVRVEVPHYAGLFDDDRVLHRPDIYGYGPPNPEADPHVVELAKELPAPILDFGCGSGALVRALRACGLEAFGIEIDRPEIAAALRDDVKPWITLREGATLPFPDRRFGSVICTEVLEHIPDFETAVAEMARVAPEALITVPDMSSIPALFAHHVVPWHLLESTHVNFFTQRSLAALLARHFATVTFSRMGSFVVNGTEVHTSLVARAVSGG
jgi:2-polyprenyl-3-methyl-5-hydroxy-6-metoxy-1,4-benzoquinol methylase